MNFEEKLKIIKSISNILELQATNLLLDSLKTIPIDNYFPSPNLSLPVIIQSNYNGVLNLIQKGNGLKITLEILGLKSEDLNLLERFRFIPVMKMKIKGLGSIELDSYVFNCKSLKITKPTPITIKSHPHCFMTEIIDREISLGF